MALEIASVIDDVRLCMVPREKNEVQRPEQVQHQSKVTTVKTGYDTQKGRRRQNPQIRYITGTRYSIDAHKASSRQKFELGAANIPGVLNRFRSPEHKIHISFVPAFTPPPKKPPDFTNARFRFRVDVLMILCVWGERRTVNQVHNKKRAETDLT